MIAGADIDERRRVGANRVVLDERIRSEMPEPQDSHEAVRIHPAHPGREHVLERSRYAVGLFVHLEELRFAQRDVEIEREALGRLVEVGPLQSVPTALVARFGSSAVSHEHQLGIELEPPNGKRRAEFSHEIGADSDFRPT